MGGPGDGVRDFSLLHVVQTGCVANPASYKMGAGTISLGVQRQKREVEQLPPSSYP
jgi:hypothetical protein